MKRTHVLLILLVLTIFGGVREYFSLPRLVDRVRPSVVYVEVISVWGNQWSGSGVVLDNGLVLTAAHVVDDANSIAVIFDDGSRVTTSEYFISKDLGVADVGLIVIGDRDEHAYFAPFDGDVGDEVFTIGSPLCFQNTVAVGILSAHNKIICGEWLHQLDINGAPGSSGCPVFNRFGNVTGIIVRGNSYGMMFTVPLEVCKAVVNIYDEVQKAQAAN